MSGSASLQDQGENIKKWDRIHLLYPGLFVFVLFFNTQKSFFFQCFEFLKAHGDMSHVFMVYSLFYVSGDSCCLISCFLAMLVL